MDAAMAQTRQGKMRPQHYGSSGLTAPPPAPSESRKGSMTSQSGLNRFFRRGKGVAGDGDDDGDGEVEIGSLATQHVSLEDITHMRDQGPYGGIKANRMMEDSTPIIPTIGGSSLTPSLGGASAQKMSNTQYRKQMNSQMKMAYANGARANSMATGMGVGGMGGDPRTMSFNSYGDPRTMSMMSGPRGPAGPRQGPRTMSLMNNNRAQPYARANSMQGPGGPRTMSMNGPNRFGPMAPPMAPAMGGSRNNSLGKNGYGPGMGQGMGPNGQMGGQMGQMGGQMGQMGGMGPNGQMGQMGPNGQMGQMGQMGGQGQMNQMSQMGGQGQMNQMGPNGMGPNGQMNGPGYGQYQNQNQFNQPFQNQPYNQPAQQYQQYQGQPGQGFQPGPSPVMESPNQAQGQFSHSSPQLAQGGFQNPPPLASHPSKQSVDSLHQVIEEEDEPPEQPRYPDLNEESPSASSASLNKELPSLPPAKSMSMKSTSTSGSKGRKAPPDLDDELSRQDSFQSSSSKLTRKPPADDYDEPPANTLKPTNSMKLRKLDLFGKKPADPAPAKHLAAVDDSLSFEEPQDEQRPSYEQSPTFNVARPAQEVPEYHLDNPPQRFSTYEEEDHPGNAAKFQTIGAASHGTEVFHTATSTLNGQSPQKDRDQRDQKDHYNFIKSSPVRHPMSESPELDVVRKTSSSSGKLKSSLVANTAFSNFRSPSLGSPQRGEPSLDTAMEASESHDTVRGDAESLASSRYEAESETATPVNASKSSTNPYKYASQSSVAEADETFRQYGYGEKGDYGEKGEYGEKVDEYGEDELDGYGGQGNQANQYNENQYDDHYAQENHGEQFEQKQLNTRDQLDQHQHDQSHTQPQFDQPPEVPPKPYQNMGNGYGYSDTEPSSGVDQDSRLSYPTSNQYSATQTSEVSREPKRMSYASTEPLPVEEPTTPESRRASRSSKMFSLTKSSKNFLKRLSKGNRKSSAEGDTSRRASAASVTPRMEAKPFDKHEQTPVVQEEPYGTQYPSENAYHRPQPQDRGFAGSPVPSAGTATPVVPQTANPRPLYFTKEEMAIMTCNNDLLTELELVTTELASSIKRELALESGSRHPQAQAHEQAADQSRTIAQLQEKLNDERRKRFLAEEHAMLYEHGQQPSALKLNYEKSELYKELLIKSDMVSQLEDRLADAAQGAPQGDQTLFDKYNEILQENTDLKFRVIPELERKFKEAEQRKINTLTKQLSLVGATGNTSFDDADESAEQIATLKKQREELREAVSSLTVSHKNESRQLTDRIKQLEGKVRELKSFNDKLNGRVDPDRKYGTASGGGVSKRGESSRGS
ncbi:hypothetical protein DICA4_F23596 [Diutina catenulata]